jgi:tartrate-resistant acid phosphatase type 5
MYHEFIFGNSVKKLLFIVYFLLATRCYSQSPGASQQKLHLSPKSLNFLVVGDWGRQGDYHQSDVAKTMNDFSDQYDAKFIISTGDNFYVNGVRSIHDPLWQSSFEDVYRGIWLQKDWYVVLGNHDYHGSPQAEIDYTQISRRWNMPSRYFSVTQKIDKNDSALFLFIDSSPFLVSYQQKSSEYSDLAKQDTLRQLRWIDSCLSTSKAQWKVVVGHHPVYSGDTEHGNTDELVVVLDPILKKYHAQFYVCGHAHDMQYMHPSTGSVDYVVSGAGSQTRPTGHLDITKFSDDVSGFALFSFTADSAQVNFIDYNGNLLYTAKRAK